MEPMFEPIPYTQATAYDARQCDARDCRALATYWSHDAIGGPPEWPRRLRLCSNHVPAYATNAAP